MFCVQVVVAICTCPWHKGLLGNKYLLYLLRYNCIHWLWQSICMFLITENFLILVQSDSRFNGQLLPE